MIACPHCGGPAVAPVRKPGKEGLVMAMLGRQEPGGLCGCGLMRVDNQMGGFWLLVPDQSAMWSNEGMVFRKSKRDEEMRLILPSGVHEAVSEMVCEWVLMS